MAYAGKSSGQWDTHSTAVALQNLLLAAYAEGLGGVWTDGILVKEPEINALLGDRGEEVGCRSSLRRYPDEVPRVAPPGGAGGCNGSVLNEIWGRVGFYQKKGAKP